MPGVVGSTSSGPAQHSTAWRSTGVGRGAMAAGGEARWQGGPQHNHTARNDAVGAAGRGRASANACRASPPCPTLGVGPLTSVTWPHPHPETHSPGPTVRPHAHVLHATRGHAIWMHKRTPPRTYRHTGSRTHVGTHSPPAHSSPAARPRRPPPATWPAAPTWRVVPESVVHRRRRHVDRHAGDPREAASYEHLGSGHHQAAQGHGAEGAGAEGGLEEDVDVSVGPVVWVGLVVWEDVPDDTWEWEMGVGRWEGRWRQGGSIALVWCEALRSEGRAAACGEMEAEAAERGLASCFKHQQGAVNQHH